MISNILKHLTSQCRALLEFLKQRFIHRRIATLSITIGVLISIGFFLLYIIVKSGALGAIPNKEELAKIKNPVASEVYSADSVLLGRFFIQERSDIPSNQIPQHLIDVLIATEDVRFYEHHGIDYRSFGRVLLKSILLQSENSGGGSTLTQQLAKNLYPRKSYWMFSLLINKMREMIISSTLEDTFNKQELIGLYLNTVAFGDNTFGVEAASQLFFSKRAQNLSIEEAAVLIGMLKATYNYNPRIYPQRAIERRNIVLSQLSKYKKLNSKTLDSLKSIPLKLKYNRINHNEGLAPYFRENIRNELLSWCQNHLNENDEPYNLYTDGLKIYTTIDSRLQMHAEKATSEYMKVLQTLFDKQWTKTEPWHDRLYVLNNVITQSPQYISSEKTGKSHDEIIKSMSQKKSMTVFSWDGKREKELSTLDSIKHYLKILNAGMLAMEPHTGAVKVWVGGIDHRYFQYDHVKLTTKRQVGSVIKPIIYAAALEQGQKPCTFISAEKTVYEDSIKTKDDWSPSNGEDNYSLKYSMEGALAFSVNTVAVHALEITGIKKTIQLAEKMGVESELPAVPSLALGTPSISVIEMVTAYSCFVNSGISVNPYYLTSITTHDNVILENFSIATGEQVLSEENALMMIHMLKRTVNEGTAASIRNVYNLKNDIAGKTGTTQNYADGWFMAMTPTLVIGAWVGADNPGIRLKGNMGQGAKTALPIVAKFFQKINEDKQLADVATATFDVLPPRLERKLQCDLYKKDSNLIEKIFGKDKSDSTRKFGEKKKKTFKEKLKKLFSK